MIIKYVKGIFMSNCYIVGENGQGVIIDPGADTAKISDAVKEAGLEIKAVFVTHVHFDHIASVDRVREIFKAPVMVHEAEELYMSDSLRNGSMLFGTAMKFNKPDRLLKDGCVYEYGGVEYRVLHTPGHSPGGICILAEGNVFTGDTLFRMSVGRTDLGNGDPDKLMHSIRDVLMRLDDETVVYPGHGPSSTIGREKRNNPFITSGNGRK